MAAQELITLRETVSSLEAQLVALYDAQQGESIEELREIISGLEEQLVSLYSTPVPSLSAEQAQEMIQSLESQVVSILDEKQALEHELKNFGQDLQRLKQKARDMGAALFEAALFNSMGNLKNVI